MDVLDCRLRKRPLKNGDISLALEIQSGSSSPFQQDAGSDKGLFDEQGVDTKGMGYMVEEATVGVRGREERQNGANIETTQMLACVFILHRRAVLPVIYILRDIHRRGMQLLLLTRPCDHVRLLQYMIRVMIGGYCNQIPLHSAVYPLPLEMPGVKHHVRQDTLLAEIVKYHSYYSATMLEGLR